MRNNEYLAKDIVNHLSSLVICDLFLYVYARLSHNWFILLFNNLLKVSYRKKFTLKEEFLN